MDVMCWRPNGIALMGSMRLESSRSATWCFWACVHGYPVLWPRSYLWTLTVSSLLGKLGSRVYKAVV